MHKFVFLLLLAVLAALWSCDDSNRPTKPEVPTLAYADYIWFDTTSYLIVAESRGTYEPYIDGDSIIGEPFIDVNDNGVFDIGIDIFIMSTGDDNMDLNHNGRHDGPDDPYTPGTPYDDYNGDGDFDRPNFSFDAGEPYYDRNNDGQWTGTATGALELGTRLYKCEYRNNDSIRFFVRDSAYQFVSDSGGYHMLWPREWVWKPFADYYDRAINRTFLATDSGLLFTDEEFAILRVLPKGEIVEGVFVDTGIYGGMSDTGEFIRTITFDTLMVVDQDTFPSLLEVTLEIPNTLRRYRFWFDDEVGFAGMYMSDWEQLGPFHILSRENAVPLPMTTQGGR